MLTHPAVLATAKAKGLPPVKALFDLMVGAGDDFERVVCGQGQAFLDMAEKDRESVLSEARTQTQFLDSPALREVLTKSDFRLRASSARRSAYSCASRPGTWTRTTVGCASSSTLRSARWSRGEEWPAKRDARRRAARRADGRAPPPRWPSTRNRSAK